VGVDIAFEEVTCFGVAAALEEGFGAEAEHPWGGALGVGEGGEEFVEAIEVDLAAVAEDGFSAAFEEFLVTRIGLEEFLEVGFGLGVLTEEEEFFGADFGGVVRLVDEFGPEAGLGGAGRFFEAADEGEVADGVADVGGVGFFFVGGGVGGFGGIGFGLVVGLGVDWRSGEEEGGKEEKGDRDAFHRQPRFRQTASPMASPAQGPGLNTVRRCGGGRPTILGREWRGRRRRPRARLRD